METIGLVPLILMLITRTASISLAQVPTHPTTPLVGTASMRIHVVSQITRSGDVRPLHGSLSNVGIRAYYQSSTPTTSVNNAYFYNFDHLNIYQSDYNFRPHSLSMRCLAF